MVGRTALTLQPVQIPDISVAGAYEGRIREDLIALGVRALVAVPILREGRLIGGLVVNRTQPGEFRRTRWSCSGRSRRSPPSR